MKAAVLRYRVMAYVTGVVLVILCFVGIPLQVAGYPAVANDVGVVHGILYIIYLVFAWLLARRLRLATKPTVIMLLAGTVPIMTFIVERWVTRRFINPVLTGQAQPARRSPVGAERETVTEPEHYFSARPGAPHRPGQVRVILPDVYLELATDAGVFSPGRLDPGTRLLLEESPAPPASGDLLDLGCGYGPVACVLAARSPGATVWAVDVNERALELCARNASAAGLANVRCVTPGDAVAAGPVRRDLVQPAGPHRQGRAARTAVVLARRGWIRPADAYLVVARNLGADSLHRWLAGQGWPVRTAGRTERLPPAPGGLSGRTSRGDTPVNPPGPAAAGAPRQLRPTEVKRLNREWRRASDTRLALLLDSVAQPFNVGSIVRSAAAFGAEHLWLCGNTAPLSHPGVGKTALGTQRLVEATQEPNPVAAAKAAADAGLRVVVVELAAGAVPLHEAPLDGDVCLAVGNEDHGCTAALLAVADAVTYIPQSGRVGSLNVAVAAAVAMAEARRRAWAPPIA